MLAPLLAAGAIDDQFDTGSSQRRLAETLGATARAELKRRVRGIAAFGGGRSSYVEAQLSESYNHETQ